jgi:hypothetical protein
MQVTRINDGLWRWSVQRGRFEWASAYLEHGDVMLLVDPVLPSAEEDLERFTGAIERDLARLGGAVHVMSTRADDARDAASLVAMTGGTRWVPGDDPPPGIEVHATGAPGEVALWSPSHLALMPGRAITFDAGTLVAGPGADVVPLLALPAHVVIPSIGPMMARGAAV